MPKIIRHPTDKKNFVFRAKKAELEQQSLSEKANLQPPKDTIDPPDFAQLPATNILEKKERMLIKEINNQQIMYVFSWT